MNPLARIRTPHPARPVSRAPWALLALGLLATLQLPAWSADQPVVVVTIFHSAEDPAWPAAKKQLEAIAARHPRVQLKLQEIDSTAGYQALAAEEKRLGVAEPGEMLMVLGDFHLTSKGKRRDIETYLEALLTRLLDPQSPKGRWPVKPSERLKLAVEAFGQGVEVGAEAEEGEGGKELLFYRVTQGGQLRGWVVDAFEALSCPVCSDTQFLVAVGHPQGVLRQLQPVRPLEIYAKPLDQQETAKFLKQLQGRTASQARASVDAISGATKTSRAYQITCGAILEAARLRSQKATTGPLGPKDAQPRDEVRTPDR